MASEDAGFRRKQRHHFQVHDLPTKLQLKNVLGLFGANSVDEAVRALQEKKPAQLRVLFQKVYKTHTKSQNKLWLQRRLVEALRLKPSDFFPLTSRSRHSTATDSSPASTDTGCLAEASHVEGAHPAPLSGGATKSEAGSGSRRRISPRLAAAAAAATTAEPTTPTAVDFTFVAASEECSDSADLALREEPAASVQLPPAELSISPLPPPPPPSAALRAALEAAEAGRMLQRAQAVADVNRAMGRLQSMRESCLPVMHVQIEPIATPRAAPPPPMPPVPQYNIPMPESPFLGLPTFIPDLPRLPSGLVPPEDEPYLALDPLLVDLDMELMPDGSLW